MNGVNGMELQILGKVPGLSRGSAYYLNDGYMYFSHQVTQTAEYFRCNKYREGCSGRAIMYFMNGKFLSTGVHNHDPNAFEVHYHVTRSSVLNQSQNSRLALFQDTFNDPRYQQLVNANPLFTRRSLMPSMIRAQSNVLPPCENLVQLSAVLSSPDFSCLTRINPLEDILYRGCAQGNDGSHSILLMSKKGCDFLKIIPSVFIQHIPVQLESLQWVEMCVIGGFWDNCSIPLAWILFQEYNEEALLAGFNLLKSSVANCVFSRACAADIAASTFSSVFSIDVQPTLYDFINSIALFLRSSDGSHSLKQIVSLCCVLPLLPIIDYLQIGIDVIRVYALQSQTYSEAAPVFQYIENEWLKNPQHKFLVLENVDRTNNGCENLRNKVNAKFASCTHNFYSVIRFIVSQSIKTDSLIDRIQLGESLAARVPVPLLQQTDLINLRQEIIKPSFSLELAVQNFLFVASEKIRHLI